MLQQGGIKLRHKSYPYQVYRDTIYDGYVSSSTQPGAGKGFTGIAHRAVRGYPSVAIALFGMMHKDGGFFHGATPDGRNAFAGDPKVNDLIDKIKAEPELARQQALAQEAIRYLSGQVYNVPRPANVKGFTLWWPAIGNLGMTATYAGGNVQVETRRDWWVDATKPPLAKA